MRIAIVLDYSLDLIGGAQRAALNEAEALVDAGHGVLLVAPRPADPSAVLPHGVDALWTAARRLPALDFPLVVDDAPLRARFVQHLRAARIDAVHLHSEFGHARAALHAARVLGLPVVHTIHTAYWPGVPAPARAIARRLLATVAGPVARRSANPLLDHTLAVALAADVVISPSAHQAADLAVRGIDATVLPNCGAGEAAAAPLPATDHLRVAWVGRCVPEKRLLTFVHAVRIAQRELPADRLRVAVAGDGLLLPVAKRFGAPGLVFLGRLERPAVRDLLAASHLSALTSHGFDNQPMTVVESIRAGRGVLHTDPRLTEGLDRAGILTAAPTAQAFADQLVELAFDRRRVRAAAAGAREAATLFAPKTHVASLLPLLSGVRTLAA
jgi:glycosyltransferase involved in cell wall biosynthesis